ncbi:hypothetical protein ATO5_12125 [Loktanella sp. 22II-4b]|nr:hypothetical protein ATO5_12125 [Loktanella sp. 22II-4b]
MRPVSRLLIALPLVALVAACTPGTPGPDGVFDPYEQANRSRHASSLRVDQAVVKPVSDTYGTVVPRPVRRGVSNFASNLDLPGIVVNDVLQFKVENAVHNTWRFAINSTIGVAGLFDVAGSMGLPERDNDFGRTLHAWGAPEGAYLVLPVLGPSTERDFAGKVVDFIINPTRYLLESPESYYGTGAKVLKKLGDRHQYSDVLDSVIYQSADSYGQARMLYLQNRRFELGIDVSDQYIDPYEVSR